MNKDELMVIVEDALYRSNGDKGKAITSLQRAAEYSPTLMVAFAKYGEEICKALLDKKSSVSH